MFFVYGFIKWMLPDVTRIWFLLMLWLWFLVLKIYMNWSVRWVVVCVPLLCQCDCSSLRRLLFWRISRPKHLTFYMLSVDFSGQYSMTTTTISAKSLKGPCRILLQHQPFSVWLLLLLLLLLLNRCQDGTYLNLQNFI